MKKIHLFVFVFVLFSSSLLQAQVSEEFWMGKVIFVDQYTQKITAYLNGVPVPERDSMPTITGDAKFPTPQGIYRVEKKDRDYFSKKYNTPMPFSLFFIFSDEEKMAIHEGLVPATKKETSKKATHGCVHARKLDAQWLFDWADEKTTKVVVYGDRSQD